MSGFSKLGMKLAGASASGNFSRALSALMVAFLCVGLAPARGDEPVSSADSSASPKQAVFPWIADVVKMNNAGVAPETILGYLKTTSARSILTADDIIYLQNHKVSPTIIAAMIEHGNAPVNTVTAAAPPLQAQSAQPSYPPPVTYSAPAPAPAYSAPYASYAYSYPPDYANPYYYYYYDYSYPNYYPGFSFYLPYTAIVTGRFHDRDHDRFFGHAFENHRFKGSIGTRGTGGGRPIAQGGGGNMRGGGGRTSHR